MADGIDEDTKHRKDRDSDPPDPVAVSVGGAVVDRYYRLSNLPEPDGGSFVRASWRSFGGAAANVACTLQRLDRKTAMITRLGTDEAGSGYEDADALEADLRGRGVDASRVRRGEETGTYSKVLVGPGGQRMVVTGGDSVRSLRLGADDWRLLGSARVVATNAYAPDPVVADLVEAREAGRLSALAFDLSGPLAELEGRGTKPGTIDRLLETADLVVAGEVALQSYCEYLGIDPTVEAAADYVRDRGVDKVALTRGEAGATLVAPDSTVDVPAFDVEVVDATGAGDAFGGALVEAWILEDRPPAEAGRFAAATAALNCTAEGARGGLPTREAVRAFLEDRS